MEFQNAGLVSMSDANIYCDGTQDSDYRFHNDVAIDYMRGGLACE